jgi:MoxR-like ATPase
MARISTIKEVIRLCGMAGITPFIWGHRGLGKSALVKQYAAENRMGVIDLRCSQLEASDIRGLPKAGEDGRTHYLPPADMPKGDMTDRQVIEALAETLGIKHDKKDDDAIADEIQATLADADMQVQRKYYEKLRRLQPRFERGILFLDEVNRAQDDVQQSVFELVLDKSVGEYVLPPGWIIVSAGNFMEGYMVTGFTDPAFLDRFCHVTLSNGEQTLEEWVDYMAGAHGEYASDVIEFASHNTDHLDGKIEGELGFNIQPSRRSWEQITKLHTAYLQDGGVSETARMECYAGLIGRDLAAAFSRYSCPVKPRALLQDGVKAHQRALKGLNRNQMTGVMWGLVAFCKNRINEDKVAEVCIDFASFMTKEAADKDVVVAFCRALVSSGNKEDQQEKARAAVISNPRLASMISKFNKKGGGKKTFVDRLAERPELQDALSKVSWGTSDDDEE